MLGNFVLLVATRVPYGLQVNFESDELSLGRGKLPDRASKVLEFQEIS